MKKFLLIAGCVAAFAVFGSNEAQAVEAPEVTSRYNVSGQGEWAALMNVDFIFWKDEAEHIPYTLTINSEYESKSSPGQLDRKYFDLIVLTKNLTENVPVDGVSMVEYQYDDNTTNYEDAWLSLSIDYFDGLLGANVCYYTLEIPEGIFNINLDGQEIAMPKITYSFTIRQEDYPQYEVPSPVLSPAEGVVSSLETVQITWPNEETELLSLLKMFQENKISVEYNGEAIEGWKIEWGWASKDDETDDQNGNIMYVNLGKEYTTPGVYTINLPKAIMWISDQDGGGSMDNPAYTWTYQVVAEPQPLAAPTVDPAEGEMTSLSVFTLTWADDVTLEESEAGANVTFTLNGNEIEGLSVETAVEGNVLTVTLSEEQTAVGTYVLNVPEGYVLYNTADGYTYYNEVVNVEYTILPSEVAPGVLPQPTKVTPENSALVEELSMVTLSWENAEVILNPDCEDQPVLSQLGSSSTYYAEASISNGSLVLEFVDVPKGAYSLLIPAGYVMALIDDVPYLSPEIALTYGVNGESTGIESIKAAVENGEVYNLQGVRVANPQRGLYIINGKKVLVK